MNDISNGFIILRKFNRCSIVDHKTPFFHLQTQGLRNNMNGLLRVDQHVEQQTGYKNCLFHFLLFLLIRLLFWFNHKLCDFVFHLPQRPEEANFKK